jgi:ribosome biogenesis GTPase A
MSEIAEINWFPGHMAKAIGKIQEKLKQCDGVIEIGDARAPFSSFPEYLDRLTQGKVKILVFSKADLADPAVFKTQLAEFRRRGSEPFSFDLRDPKASQSMLKYLSSVKTSQDARYQRLGFPLPIKHFIVLGIPNVGKSTFINSLAGKKKAEVENRPGKTRSEPLIQVSDKVYIFDAPGILEPNYENKKSIAKLALLGSVKMEVLPVVALTEFLLSFLIRRYSSCLASRYGVNDFSSPDRVLEQIAVNRKLLSSGNRPDVDRARMMLLSEFRNGELGRISLDDAI